MAGSLLIRINVAIQRLELAIASVLGRRFPPDGVCLAGVQLEGVVSTPKPAFSLKDIVGDGFLWGVPTARRTIERRLKRKFGDPKYVLKILKPASNIRTCNVCGDDHLAGVLCPTCYKKVIDETKEMQETIQNELQLSPVEKEVVVLYQGEKDGKPDEFWEGKRIVEMQKPRPPWFSKNLLQQTTQQPATTSDVKPSDLG
jgi:large subunit ribosomal protein L32